MGKRRKRLTMAKYAKKYASIRATVARLRGETIEEATTDTPEVTVAENTVPNALKATIAETSEEELLVINEPEVEIATVVSPIPPVEEENTNTEIPKTKTTKKTTTKKAKTTKKATKTTTKKRGTKKTANAD